MFLKVCQYCSERKEQEEQQEMHFMAHSSADLYKKHCFLFWWSICVKNIWYGVGTGKLQVRMKCTCRYFGYDCCL